MSEPQGRLAGKTAVVVGGGQVPGEDVGNGRAVAMLFAREGARVLVGDRNLGSAAETVDLIRADGGVAGALEVDVTNEADLERIVATCVEQWGRLDILHNNVGVIQAGVTDGPVTDIAAEAFSRLMDINLRGMVLACKHAIPVMRNQGGGAIVNISSVAARIDYPRVAYKTSKAAVIALTEHLAITNAPFGIRANVILPGLIATPMAIELRRQAGMTRSEILDQRSAMTPLRGRPGNAWDVANAALYLASDEAGFVTGASIPVDGGQLLVVG